MPTLILLQPEDRHSGELLARAATQSGWQVQQPFGVPMPNNLRERNRDVVLYGDWRLLCATANLLNLAILAPTANWLLELPDEYRRRQLGLLSWGEALELDRPFFIKPIDWKWGRAKVYARGSELPDPDSIPLDMAMLVAEPVEFELEFRCFILDREVATYSPYFQNGRSTYNRGRWMAPVSAFDEVLAFTKTFLQDEAVAVPPAFVLDVGRIRDRGWAIVEAQPCWFSSIYGCDPKASLRVLQRACRHRTLLSTDDHPWIIQGYSLAP